MGRQFRVFKTGEQKKKSKLAAGGWRHFAFCQLAAALDYRCVSLSSAVQLPASAALVEEIPECRRRCRRLREQEGRLGKKEGGREEERGRDLPLLSLTTGMQLHRTHSSSRPPSPPPLFTFLSLVFLACACECARVEGVGGWRYRICMRSELLISQVRVRCSGESGCWAERGGFFVGGGGGCRCEVAVQRRPHLGKRCTCLITTHSVLLRGSSRQEQFLIYLFTYFG